MSDTIINVSRGSQIRRLLAEPSQRSFRSGNKGATRARLRNRVLRDIGLRKTVVGDFDGLQFR